ncbi:MAG TPA: hypothetical protein PLR39_00200 [Treponemataceae bacterium]|nr:hypothetical protein [Treponemataceae bacterium]
MKPFQKNKLCIFFLIVFFAAVSVSCGLPVYNALYPPTAYAQPTNDPLNRVFSFTTADSANAGMDIYQGVNIYYRIYNDPSSRDADINTINTSNTEFSDNGMRRLQNMGYNELSITKEISTINDTLIPIDSTNRKIQVRLFTEGFSESPYAAGIRVNNSLVSGSIPVRTVLSTSFDFFGTGPLPESTDPDVKMNSALGTDVWYVNAYAVSVGRNTSFQYFYSSILHLGYITIEK